MRLRERERPRAPSSATRRGARLDPVCAAIARATAARRSPRATRGPAPLSSRRARVLRCAAPPRTRAPARTAEAELERALLARAHLADHLGLADAGRVETGRDQEQMLGRAFALPSTQPALRFAACGSAARQTARTPRRASPGPAFARAREDELDPIASRQGRRAREAAGAARTRAASTAATSSASVNSASDSLPPCRQDTPTMPRCSSIAGKACASASRDLSRQCHGFEGETVIVTEVSKERRWRTPLRADLDRARSRSTTLPRKRDPS